MDDTRWTVERRQYFFEQWEEGVAERVRAEHKSGTAWVRILEAVYWWPAREGKDWPGLVIAVPTWSGVGPEPDGWAQFEQARGHDTRYRWEALPEG
jgi:hypothetical protein